MKLVPFEQLILQLNPNNLLNRRCSSGQDSISVATPTVKIGLDQKSLNAQNMDFRPNPVHRVHHSHLLPPR
ncbi:hypothetical protein G4B88_004683 [Cannabis sativa]|uniref:Uncharacterized protein n=1 Tax=Cannabis sativa TaxID=3483 RepID=A0A7J6FWC1_CANSA|nr:hypothetical protein G4B88_004683 [Cannabis sativa]